MNLTVLILVDDLFSTCSSDQQFTKLRKIISLFDITSVYSFEPWTHTCLLLHEMFLRSNMLKLHHWSQRWWKTQLFVIVICCPVLCNSLSTKDSFHVEVLIKLNISIFVSQIITKQYVMITKYLQWVLGTWEHIIWFVDCGIVAQ